MRLPRDEEFDCIVRFADKYSTKDLPERVLRIRLQVGHKIILLVAYYYPDRTSEVILDNRFVWLPRAAQTSFTLHANPLTFENTDLVASVSRKDAIHTVSLDDELVPIDPDEPGTSTQ
jgi:hypothetical protein